MSLVIRGNSIWLDDFEVAVLKDNVPASQIDHLDRILEVADEHVEMCDDCGCLHIPHGE